MILLNYYNIKRLYYLRSRTKQFGYRVVT